MADEVVSLDLEIRLQGAQSVAELKDVLKEAKNEALKFGVGTAEFKKFGNVANEAKDKLEAVNKSLKALDTTGKAQAFQAMGTTIVSGMQSATASVAIFTGGNEELNAVLIQSMAIVQGLQGLQTISDAKKQLGLVKNILGIKTETAATQQLTGATVGQTAATTAATGATKLMRAALIATGIGAIVVLVGLLIANWDKITASFKGFDKVANQFKAVFAGMWEAVKVVFTNIAKGAEIVYLMQTLQFGKAMAATKEFQSVTEAYQKGHEGKMQDIAQDAANKILAKTVESNKRLANEMEAAGKDTYAIRRQILKDELSLLDKDAEDYATQYADKQSEIRVLDAQHKKELSDAAKQAQDKKNADAAKQAEKDKADAQKEIDRLAALEAEKSKIRDQFAEDKLQYELSEEERELLEVERKKQEFINAGVSQLEAEEFARIQKFDINRKYDQLDLEAQQEADKKSEANLKASNDKKIEDAKRLREAQLSLAGSLATGIANIGILMTSNAKKQETFNKVAAGIQIGIDTARGITSAVAAAKGLTGFDYIAQVALGVGSVLANAAKAKQLLSKVGGSAPTIDTGTLSAAQSGAQQSAPSFNPANQKTTLDEAERRRASGGQGESMQKVYIVSSELTEKQNRLQALKDRRVK